MVTFERPLHEKFKMHAAVTFETVICFLTLGDFAFANFIIFIQFPSRSAQVAGYEPFTQRNSYNLKTKN